MEQRHRLARLVLYFGLALLVGSCASSKKPVTRLVLRPEPAVVPVSAPAEPVPLARETRPPLIVPPPPTPVQERVDLLIIQSRELVDEGKRYCREGKVEEGRRCFKLALDHLKNSGLGFYENPQLEQAYYTFLSEIQAEELRVMMALSQQPVPEIEEPTPLDEISDLNLYSIEVDPHLRELLSQDILETKFDIPVVLNDQVVRVLDYYQNRGRRIMEEGLRRSGKYIDIFRETFEKEGIPLDLAYVSHVESLFNPRARSRARAIGLWQFMKGTGQLYNLRQDWWVDERSDIVKSTQAAARYMKVLYEDFKDWHLVLAAYNVGPGRIQNIVRRKGEMDYWTMAQRKLLPRETVNHVPSILAALIIFKNPERYGFDVVPELPLKFDLVPMEFQVDLKVVAEAAGVSVEQLRELNPELKWGVTPAEPKGYSLKVPEGSGESVQVKLAALPPSQRLKFAHYRVRKGDTLGAIARKHATSVEAIAQMNRIKRIKSLRINQDLIIPGAGWRGEGRELAKASSTPAVPVAASRHIVRKGESLSTIAQRYGVSVEDLRQWNKLRRGQLIYPGQTLRLEKRAERSGLAPIGGNQ
ncbi:MAG: LysM peptidoglycan-binding domain-containing protein [Acidobacteria bacterium]|nr:MAG: LysM peptidoglycan-binding domain-containing protein [Acidobacteriota bacterium]